MRASALLPMLAALAVPGRAYATPSARLVYARSGDAATCPDETALRKAVSARFGYDPFFAWAKQTIVVQLAREGGRYTARVQLVDEEGLARGTREIASDEPSCSELFDAAALAISIALDASVQTAPPPPATPPPPAEAPASDETSRAPLAPAPAEEPAPEAPPQTTPAAPPRPPGPLRLGVDALASAGLGSNVMPGLDGFASLRRGTLSVGLELRVDAAPPVRVALPDSFPNSARVAFAIVAVTLAPCAHLGRAFACVLGEAGSIQAWALDLTNGRSDAAIFAAAGARVGVEWPLSDRVFLRLRGDLVADLTPATFQLDHQQPVTASALAGTIGAGVGAQLP